MITASLTFTHRQATSAKRDRGGIHGGFSTRQNLVVQVLLRRAVLPRVSKSTSKTVAKNVENQRRREVEQGFNNVQIRRENRVRQLREVGDRIYGEIFWRVARARQANEIPNAQWQGKVAEAMGPGFTLTAVLTLALGIGANTAVFTLTHALLLRTLPVRDPGQLVRLAINLSAFPPHAQHVPLNLPIIVSIQKQPKSLHDVFAWCVYDFPFRDGSFNGGIHGTIVSGNAFQALGVRPAAGRLLTQADDQPGGGSDGLAAVISYRIWVSRYNADPSIIGRHITVTAHHATIVGVAPPGFEGVVAAEHPDIYLPLEFQGVLYGEPSKHDGGRLWLDTFARLHPSGSRAAAGAGQKTPFHP